MIPSRRARGSAGSGGPPGRGSHPGAAALCAAALLFACSSTGGPDTPDAGAQAAIHQARSTSIALDGDERRVFVLSSDDDRVMRLDSATLEATGAAETGLHPVQLALLPNGRLVITHAQDRRLAIVDWSTPSPAVRYVDTPCGGTFGVVAEDADGKAAWVSCNNDNLVLRLDTREWTITHRLTTPDAPGTLAVLGDQLAIAYWRSGRIAMLNIPAARRSASAEARPLEPAAVMNIQPPGAAPRRISSFHALTPLIGLSQPFAAAALLVDNDGDRGRPPEQGGYGSVADGKPRIEPVLWGPWDFRYAGFSGGPKVFNSPSAMAYSAASGLLWVTHQTTNNVALIGSGRVIANFPVNSGPRGIALSRDGRTAWVDCAFDWSVARLEAPAPADDTRVIGRSPERTWPVSPKRLSPAALEGRKLFHDAENIQLTPSGVVTCATCHPNGGEDGLNWFLHTRGVPRKLRRTPAAWNAKASLAPYPRDGKFKDTAVLSRATTLELMEGAGLVVNFNAFAAYMDELKPPPGRPVADEEGPLLNRGRELFYSKETGCAGCHQGEWFTDKSPHAVSAASSDGDARMEKVITPPLRGVRARAPYLHDGRAASLKDLFAIHNPGDSHGVTSRLKPEDLDALIFFLHTL
ncbi:MAG: Virginiamycin B lyase [Myxococcota bacterium]|nr:Virginiamycin B lyase [Myxococcota bacterium]